MDRKGYNSLTIAKVERIIYPPVKRMTGTEFLTGVLRWFLFQNGNFPKVAETAADHKMRCRQPIWFNAVIVARCVCPIQSALIADIMPVKKSSTWAKRPRKNKVYREKKRTEKSVFLLSSFLHHEIHERLENKTKTKKSFIQIISK